MKSRQSDKRSIRVLSKAQLAAVQGGSGSDKVVADPSAFDGQVTTAR